MSARIRLSQVQFSFAIGVKSSNFAIGTKPQITNLPKLLFICKATIAPSLNRFI